MIVLFEHVRRSVPTRESVNNVPKFSGFFIEFINLIWYITKSFIGICNGANYLNKVSLMNMAKNSLFIFRFFWFPIYQFALTVITFVHILSKKGKRHKNNNCFFLLSTSPLFVFALRETTGNHVTKTNCSVHFHHCLCSVDLLIYIIQLYNREYVLCII